MNDVLGKIKPPAIALIIVGALNGAIGLLTLLSGLSRLTGVIPFDEMPVDKAERTGFIVATVFGYSVALISLITAPVIVYGGFQMLNGRSYQISRISSILAIIPFVSCCFIAGIPIGIWALVVLNEADVKAFLAGDFGNHSFNGNKF